MVNGYCLTFNGYCLFYLCGSNEVENQQDVGDEGDYFRKRIHHPRLADEVQVAETH